MAKFTILLMLTSQVMAHTGGTINIPLDFKTTCKDFIKIHKNLIKIQVDIQS